MRFQRRIQAEDVVINIGKEATVPAPPPGHEWKEVIHNKTVGWLAGWKDSINTKDWKCVCRRGASACILLTRALGQRYVQLGHTSSLKADSDLSKFEKVQLPSPVALGVVLLSL